LDNINPDRLRRKIAVLHHLLQQAYGPKPHRLHDPVETLVVTILSQNTNDVNRDRAYQELRRQFPTWQAMRDADPEQIIAAIRVAGLANHKGPHIQTALRAISAHSGELTLEFLRDMPMDDARRWLMSVDGVGPKTAAIVLCFGFGRPAFPVDTHVHRVTGRLGLIGPKVGREQAHVILEALVPGEWCYEFHINLIEHGRLVCKAPRPLCPKCTLTQHCDYYQAVVIHRGEGID
jgi:endonuclease III